MKNSIVYFLTIGLLLFFSIVYSINEDVKREIVDDIALFKIYKIDSINNYYLIYAQKDNIFYKIVSEKSENDDCKKISIGEQYDLVLTSIWYEKFARYFIPSGLLTNAGLALDNEMKTVVFLEKDSINDIHIAENLKGLCFIPNVKRIISVQIEEEIIDTICYKVSEVDSLPRLNFENRFIRIEDYISMNIDCKDELIGKTKFILYINKYGFAHMPIIIQIPEQCEREIMRFRMPRLEPAIKNGKPVSLNMKFHFKDSPLV